MKIKKQLNISVHCLGKTQVNEETQEKTNWKKPQYKTIEWIKNYPDFLKAMEEDLLPKMKKKNITE